MGLAEAAIEIAGRVVEAFLGFGERKLRIKKLELEIDRLLFDAEQARAQHLSSFEKDALKTTVLNEIEIIVADVPGIDLEWGRYSNSDPVLRKDRRIDATESLMRLHAAVERRREMARAHRDRVISHNPPPPGWSPVIETREADPRGDRLDRSPPSTWRVVDQPPRPAWERTQERVAPEPEIATSEPTVRAALPAVEPENVITQSTDERLAALYERIEARRYWKE